MNLLKEHRRERKGNRFIGTLEHKGFKVGDKVRLKIVAVPKDHQVVISTINAQGEFKVLLKSEETQDANGTWGPIWAEEMEGIDNAKSAN